MPSGGELCVDLNGLEMVTYQTQFILILSVILLFVFGIKMHLRTGQTAFLQLPTMLQETMRADKSSWRKCE